MPMRVSRLVTGRHRATSTRGDITSRVPPSIEQRAIAAKGSGGPIAVARRQVEPAGHLSLTRSGGDRVRAAPFACATSRSCRPPAPA